jgi:hypothetical protein
VRSAHRDEAAGDDAVELARESGDELEGLAVDRPRRVAQDLGEDIRRRALAERPARDATRGVRSNLLHSQLQSQLRATNQT